MRVHVPALAPYSLDGATQTGAGDVWADSTDATFITIATTSPPVSNDASGAIPGRVAGGYPHVPLHATMWTRFKVAAGLAPHPRLVIAGTGMSYDGETPIADPEPGWMRSRFTDSGYIANWNDGYSGVLQLSGRFTPDGNVTVYEAMLTFEWHGDAPPCRILQRSDGLGVGAGRAYPPAKSQQRSPGNRGVSYY